MMSKKETDLSIIHTGCKFLTIYTNTLVDLINHKSGIGKIFLYAKDPYEPKHQLEINKCEGVGLIQCYNQNIFNKNSRDINDTYKNIDDYNPGKKQSVLIMY